MSLTKGLGIAPKCNGRSFWSSRTWLFTASCVLIIADTEWLNDALMQTTSPTNAVRETNTLC